jgi:hypothetical protein
MLRACRARQPVAPGRLRLGVLPVMLRTGLYWRCGRRASRRGFAEDSFDRAQACGYARPDRPGHARPRHELEQRRAGEAPRPDRRHPVGDEEVGFVDQALLDRVAAVAAQVVEVRRDRPWPRLAWAASTIVSTASASVTTPIRAPMRRICRVVSAGTSLGEQTGIDVLVRGVSLDRLHAPATPLAR